jgi:hypothetical protein
VSQSLLLTDRTATALMELGDGDVGYLDWQCRAE